LSCGYDVNGIYRQLADGRVLRVHRRMFNTLLSLSDTREDEGWREGW